MDIALIAEFGGPLMVVLAGLSVVGLGIVILKAYHLYRCRDKNPGLPDNICRMIEAGDIGKALLMLKEEKGPVAELMERTLICFSKGLSRKDIETEISRAGSLQVRSLESWLGGLSLIGNLAPLLGLLGTVLGMIKAFKDFTGSGTSGLLAHGIWEALLTTAVGLAIAIPAIACYCLFEGQVDSVRAAMKDGAVRILTALAANRDAQPEVRESGEEKKASGF